MTAHELANKLLALPDETVFIQTEDEYFRKGLYNINDVNLCSCESEIIITHLEY